MGSWCSSTPSFHLPTLSFFLLNAVSFFASVQACRVHFSWWFSSATCALAVSACSSSSVVTYDFVQPFSFKLILTVLLAAVPVVSCI